MAGRKLRSLITCFTPEGNYFAILSPNGVVKIWNTNSGSLLTEWKQSDNDSDVTFSCLACSFIGKKARKERGALLIALGSDAGEILAVDVIAGERKWKSAGCHVGGIAGLSFTNRGRFLRTVGSDGKASEMNAETGEVLRDFKVSEMHVTSSASCSDGKTLAISSDKIHIFSWKNGKELLKFSADGSLVQHISISDEVKAIVTSGSSEKHLQVWKCDLNSKSVSKGPVLSMGHPPVAFDCSNGADGDNRLTVLSISESGVVYVWHLKNISEEEITPTKVTVKANEGELDLQNSGSARKNCLSIMAARLLPLGTDEHVTALIAYGSTDCPQFSFLDISNPAADIVIIAGDEMRKKNSETVKENGNPVEKGLAEEDLEAVAVSIQSKKANKKRAASDPDLADTEPSVDNDVGHGEVMGGSQIEENLNEPTMGEKLASLNLQENNKVKSLEEKQSPQQAKPPSADSVHVLLKQALHADDRTLLLNCLNTQDEKVIANSVTPLNPSDVLKLLDSLISMIQSRGAVLACALPWLRSLLLQHSSGIMSQESSLIALNTLYQLIESRVSTFHPALQLSSCLDVLFSGTIVDGGFDENDTITPFVYEDKDESEEEEEKEEESQDAMETDQEGSDQELFDDNVRDIGGSDDMAFG